MVSSSSASKALKKLEKKTYTHVVLCSDHGGYSLKAELKQHIESNSSIRIVDTGNDSDTHSVDYPDMAEAAVLEYVRLRGTTGEHETTNVNKPVTVPLCILVCGTGVGISIAANKVLRHYPRKKELKNLAGEMESESVNDKNTKSQSEARLPETMDPCCLVHDVSSARYAREVLGCDVIAMGGRTTGVKTAIEILEEWI